MLMGGNVHPPVFGGFIGSVAKLQGVGRRTFAQGGHIIFVRAGRKLERFDDGFQTRENRSSNDN